jgi:8-oxo-dGTP pyrophosphatase MutT (NUDIX family)
LNAPNRIDRLADALARRTAAIAERDPPFREAAVAFVLAPFEDDAQVLLMRRATHEPDPWSGQVSLPGGRSELTDTSLLETAIRETQEESALDLTGARLLGTLDELRPRLPVLPPIIVRPYVFALASLPALVPSVEVAEFFWMPLRRLFDPARTCRTEVTARTGRLTVDAIDCDGRIVWGMTERILRSMEPVWLEAQELTVR